MHNGPRSVKDAMLYSSDLQLERAEGVIKNFNSVFTAFLVVEALLIVPIVTVVSEKN
jgi:hypothetical protein